MFKPMKVLLNTVALALILISGTASANSAGSLFTGTSIHMPGFDMIQDAQNPSLFYYLPRRYVLDETSERTIDEYGDVVLGNRQLVTHQIVTGEGGEQFSVYTFRMRLQRHPRSTILRAEQRLRETQGGRARIAGMLQVCGLRTALPTVIGDGPANPTTAGRITYGFTEAAPDECRHTRGFEEFDVEIVVPLAVEPAMAFALTEGANLPLPNVRMIHPYRYHDRASISIDAVAMQDYFDRTGSISGSIYGVGAALRDRLRRMMSQFSMMGSMQFDIQSTDPEVRNRIKEFFIEQIATTLFRYVPVPPTLPPGVPGSGGTSASAADTTARAQAAAGAGTSAGSATGRSGGTASSRPPVPQISQISSSGGSPIPWSVSAQLGFDRAHAEQRQRISFSLDEVQYGTIFTDLELQIPAISRDRIHPQIRALLPAQQ